MKEGRVFYKEIPAGTIREDESGFVFAYDKEYLSRADAQPVSLTLPLRDEPYVSQVMFPFFDGLIPEGWLLDIASSSWKVDPRDRRGLLLTCCKDCIGDISVKPLSDE